MGPLAVMICRNEAEESSMSTYGLNEIRVE